MLTKSPLLMAKTAKFPFFCCSFCQRRWNPHLCGWKKSTVLCRFNHGFLLKSPWRRLTSTFLKNPHLNWCLSKSPKNRSTYFFNWLWWRDEIAIKSPRFAPGKKRHVTPKLYQDKNPPKHKPSAGSSVWWPIVPSSRPHPVLARPCEVTFPSMGPFLDKNIKGLVRNKQKPLGYNGMSWDIPT